MKSLCLATLVSFSCFRASGAVTLDVSAAILADSNENPLSSPTTGWVVLVAGTSGGVFGGPTAGSFTSGADVLLWDGVWESGQDIDGYFTHAVDVDESLAGRAVQIYWYPTLASGQLPVYGDTMYGAYRDDTGALDGSFPWYVPTFGQVPLIFRTTDAEGSNDPEVGYALAVVPEASNVIFGGLALGVVAFQLARGARQKQKNNQQASA